MSKINLKGSRRRAKNNKQGNGNKNRTRNQDHKTIQLDKQLRLMKMRVACLTDDKKNNNCMMLVANDNCLV